MQETGAHSLVWEDPLEKEMTTHSSIPAWEIPWTEEPGRLKKVKVTQSCLTLCDHMDYTNREILQARILERVATPFFYLLSLPNPVFFCCSFSPGPENHTSF